MRTGSWACPMVARMWPAPVAGSHPCPTDSGHAPWSHRGSQISRSEARRAVVVVGHVVVLSIVTLIEKKEFGMFGISVSFKSGGNFQRSTHKRNIQVERARNNDEVDLNGPGAFEYYGILRRSHPLGHSRGLGSWYPAPWCILALTPRKGEWRGKMYLYGMSTGAPSTMASYTTPARSSTCAATCSRKIWGGLPKRESGRRQQ